MRPQALRKCIPITSELKLIRSCPCNLGPDSFITSDQKYVHLWRTFWRTDASPLLLSRTEIELPSERRLVLLGEIQISLQGGSCEPERRASTNSDHSTYIGDAIRIQQCRRVLPRATGLIALAQLRLDPTVNNGMRNLRPIRDLRLVGVYDWQDQVHSRGYAPSQIP